MILKRISAFIMSLLIILSFTACFASSSKSGETETAKPAKKTDTKKDIDTTKDTETKPSDSAKKLQNIVICIDAGHQQKQDLKKEPVAPNSRTLKEKCTSGTAGVATKNPEYKLNLDVALMLQKELEKLGATVIMTRTTNDVKLSNVDRAEIANKAKANLTIRIHADGSDNKKVQGISMLVPGSKYIKDKTVIDKSKKAGKVILESVVETTSAKSRGVVERDDLTGFNWSEVPVVLIEMGFMSNKEEDLKMNTASYRQKLVSGMAKGIEKYFSAK